MLFDTPIPTFPLTGEGAHRCRELSPIQAVHHFKDFAPLGRKSSHVSLANPLCPRDGCHGPSSGQLPMRVFRFGLPAGTKTTSGAYTYPPLATSAIAWMAEVAEADASLFTNRSDPAAASDFKDRIQQRLDDAQEEDPDTARPKKNWSGPRVID